MKKSTMTIAQDDLDLFNKTYALFFALILEEPSIIAEIGTKQKKINVNTAFDFSNFTDIPEHQIDLNQSIRNAMEYFRTRNIDDWRQQFETNQNGIIMVGKDLKPIKRIENVVYKSKDSEVDLNDSAF